MEKLYADRLGEQAERLADHAERGAIWDKALEYLQRSGFRACSLYANANAARFFERALTVLKKLPESPDNLRQAVDLRFGLRNALLPQGEIDQIGRCLDELDPILACLGDKLRSARYAAFRCTHHFWIGQQRRAIEFGQTGACLARECDDRVLLGELLYRLAQSYYALGEYRQATKLLEQSLEFTPNELRQDRYDLSVIRSVVNRMWLVFAMVECGHFSAAMSHAKRALEIAEHAEHLERGAGLAFNRPRAPAQGRARGSGRRPGTWSGPMRQLVLSAHAPPARLGPCCRLCFRSGPRIALCE